MKVTQSVRIQKTLLKIAQLLNVVSDSVKKLEAPKDVKVAKVAKKAKKKVKKS
jgi:hypothetical protein